MNYLFLLGLVSSAYYLNATPAGNDFQLILKPQWHVFKSHSPHFASSQDEQVLVGTITFNKKDKQKISLNQLQLRWNGPKIDALFGSLYCKEQTDNFIPIEDNLICDGTWNNPQQTLKLTFDEQKSLGPVNIFYLVLTIPKEMTSSLRKGKFEVLTTCLPEPFRPSNYNELLLSLDALDTTISTQD